jgi:hypothetical protein
LKQNVFISVGIVSPEGVEMLTLDEGGETSDATLEIRG